MDKVYVDTPYNFSKIEPYILTNLSEIVREIIVSPKCYFYDTCAFRNHMNVSDVTSICEYIKSTEGVVVLTRTVIMELCSNDGNLWNEHIQYIRRLYDAGIRVIVVYEEELFEILHTYCSDIVEINKWLSYAIKCAKSKAGTVERVGGKDIQLRKALFETVECRDGKLAEKFFGMARANKTSKDNLGEEMISICVHWLSRIREMVSYKYIIFSDDKKAIGTFGKVIKNSKEFSGQEEIAVFTTAKLCYHMNLKGIISEEEQIKNILSPSNLGDNIKVYCSEEFELNPTEKEMSIDTFAQKVLKKSVKIYY